MADLHWNRAFALEQTGGDEELLEELIVLFKDSSAGDFRQLQQAVAANDAPGVMRAAHSLKGAAASLGVEGIRQVAFAIETAARQGSVTVAQENLAAMEQLLQQLSEL